MGGWDWSCATRFLGHLIEVRHIRILWAFAMLSYFTLENFNCSYVKFPIGFQQKLPRRGRLIGLFSVGPVSSVPRMQVIFQGFPQRFAQAAKCE